jgi:hypothetical protein
MMRSRTAFLMGAGVVAASVLAVMGVPASAASKKLPDSCVLVTQADVSAAFAKLEPALQPTDVSVPVRSKPTNQGGFGHNGCETTFTLPNAVAGRILVETLPVSKPLGCPVKGQPGKTVKISGTKALLEPLPSDTKVVRDVVFVDRGACASIEIFLSGGTARVPASGFVDLAKAALAKKP